MTDRQTAIADRMLALLAEHDGRFNKDEARSMLRKEFTERLDRIDITLVLDTLMDDYGLIAPIGEAWIRLTPEGETMARRGMKNYQRKLSIKEQFKVAGKVITEIYYKLLNMKRILFLIITLSLLGNIVCAQNRGYKIGWYGAYDQKPLVEIQVDKNNNASAYGSKFIFTIKNSSIKEKDGISISLGLSKVKIKDEYNFFLALNIDATERQYSWENSPLLIKLSDGEIIELKSFYDIEDKIGNLVSARYNITKYTITSLYRISNDELERFNKGIIKIRFKQNENLRDLDIMKYKKDNLSDFLLEEANIIDEKLNEYDLKNIREGF